MPLTLDIIALGVPDVRGAHDYYVATLSPVVSDYGDYVEFDNHGTGGLALLDARALAADAGSTVPSSGFRSYVISYVAHRRSQAQAVVDAALVAGATLRASMSAGLSPDIEAPDGSTWRVTSAHEAPALTGAPPVPSELGLLLGVADVPAATAFYEAVGFRTDPEFGHADVGFAVSVGSCRLGLIPRDELAQAAGVGPVAAETGGVVLNARVDRPSLVDEVMTAALAAGGEIIVAAEDAAWGGYTGQFTDPDGFRWKVGST